MHNSVGLIYLYVIMTNEFPLHIIGNVANCLVWCVVWVS